MTRARSKYPPGLSDSSLLALFRRVVLRRCDYKCVICNSGAWQLKHAPLEVHHCIKRRYKLLRYLSADGVAVHVGDCHADADRRGVYVSPQPDLLLLLSKKTFKQYLSEEGLTESEWRARTKAALLAELGGGEANGQA